MRAPECVLCVCECAHPTSKLQGRDGPGGDIQAQVWGETRRS